MVVNERELLVNSVCGIHIPQEFATKYDTQSWGIDPKDAEVLCLGPEHPDYWEIWNHVLLHAAYKDEDNIAWYLYQDEDLWAIPESQIGDVYQEAITYTDDDLWYIPKDS